MISVLLRTRNEAEHIGYCLQSINDVLGRDTEVLIANNNSTDEIILRHSYNKTQLEWFQAGSALNVLRLQKN